MLLMVVQLINSQVLLPPYKRLGIEGKECHNRSYGICRFEESRKKGLKQIRSQVVRLKKMGKSRKEIEELVGVRQNRIREIWTAYLREGEKSLDLLRN